MSNLFLISPSRSTRLPDLTKYLDGYGMKRDVTEDLSTVRQEELEQFSYMASHDLREPLRILRATRELDLRVRGEKPDLRLIRDGV